LNEKRERGKEEKKKEGIKKEELSILALAGT